MTTWTDASGRTHTTAVRLPFAVRKNGATRSFGSLERAQAAAEPGSTIFFDYAPGCGLLVEHR